MAAKQHDRAMYVKFARGLTWFAYGFAVVAIFFLLVGFVLLLFGANYSTPFVQFIYKGATAFLQPFRDIFPTHQVSETGYFNASALFASLMYALFAMLCQSFINYLTSKIELYAPTQVDSAESMNRENRSKTSQSQASDRDH